MLDWKSFSKIKLLKIFSGIIALIIVIFASVFLLYIRWSFRVSNYCQQKAATIAGDRWTTLLSATDEEKQRFGIGQISLGFREQLKCEQDPATLDKFKGLF